MMNRQDSGAFGFGPSQLIHMPIEWYQFLLENELLQFEIDELGRKPQVPSFSQTIKIFGCVSFSLQVSEQIIEIRQGYVCVCVD